MKKVFLLMLCFAMTASAVLLQNGDSIAFLGDSITEHGWRVDLGYIHLCEIAFKANGLDIKAIPAGRSGDKSNEMLARLEESVLSKHPTWMSLSCGVNDVIHKPGISLEEYQKNITAILDGCLANNIRVMVMTATMCGEDASLERNNRALAYNAWLREIAQERGLPLADLNTVMRSEVAAYRQAGGKGLLFTWDGIHMKLAGNKMMAEGLLKAFGFSEAQMDIARKAWHDAELNVWPSRCIIDIDGRDEKVMLQDTTVCSAFYPPEYPEWVAKENPAHEKCYLQFRGRENLQDEWRSFEFSFVPSKSGTVRLRLRGVETPKDAIRWIGYDDFQALGTIIANPGFETREGNAIVAWTLQPSSRKLNFEDASEGRNYVECAQYVIGEQTLSVTEGVRVTIRFMAKTGRMMLK